MTRARILADYVAGGTTAAEFDYLDGLTSTAVGINDTQTLANKTLASTTTFPAGHVIQTVHATNSYAKQHSSTSETSVDSASGVAWNPSITPTATSSHILTFWNLNFKVWRSDEKEARGTITIKYRISGTLADMPSGALFPDILGTYDYGADNSGIQLTNNYTIITKLSPSTTSAVEFLSYSKLNSTGAGCTHNDGSGYSQILMMEIAG